MTAPANSKRTTIFHSTTAEHMPEIQKSGLKDMGTGLWGAESQRAAVSHSPKTGTVMLRATSMEPSVQPQPGIHKFSGVTIPAEDIQVMTPRGLHAVPLADFNAATHVRRPPEVKLTKAQLATMEKRKAAANKDEKSAQPFSRK